MAPLEGSTLGDALIPVINKLQDIFSQVTVDLKLTLPQVAVVGSQSSGKSSVLESLVGRDFLPRGSDIVTRRPLVLQLVKTNPAQPGGRVPKAEGGGYAEEWGEFLHAPGNLFTDFDLIRQEIQAETDRVVGTNKNVSDKPIRLKVFSPHVLTMTLVDLPGMTKVPVGDQPSNIEARIRDMVLAAIKPPSVIILAVSPANGDLANSDALQLARMVDPDGVRTIGVLTKLDIMDRGTNAAHILRGHHIPLALGYVAVVNRSQEDINKATSVAAARSAEDRFFAARPEYRDVLGQCGVANLSRRLNSLLAEHIRALLPMLRRAIGDALEARYLELRTLGDPLLEDSKAARGAYLLQLLCEYSDRFSAMLEGRHQDLSAQRLTGGARIRSVFNEGFARMLRELSPVRDVSDEAILTVIKNGSGVAGNLLVPQEPFELLVRRSIGALTGPALACKEAVYEELVHIAEQTCPKEAARFPVLQRSLSGTVLGFIRGGAEPAERMIRSLLECEYDFINCDHPEFIGGRGAIRAVMQERSLRAAAAAKEVADGGGRDGSAATAITSSGLAGGGRSGKAPGISSVDKIGLGASATTPGIAMGLKGLPDGTSQPVSDELLSRTRRRSDAGYGLHHSHTADDVMQLGLGAPAGGAIAFSSLAAPGGHTPAASSSWFSWFKQSGGAGTATAGGGAANGDAGDTHAGVLRTALAGRTGGGAAGVSPKTEQEEVEVEVIRKLVDSYFAIVRRNLADAVPKAVMHFMVNRTKRGLQQHLIQQLYKEDLLEELLREKGDLVAARRAAQEAVNALKAAMNALDELPSELGSATANGAVVAGGAGGGGLLPPPTPLGMSTTPRGTALNLAPPGPSGLMDFGAPPPSAGLASSAAHSIERTPSMLAAARTATVATAALTGMHEQAVYVAESVN